MQKKNRTQILALLLLILQIAVFLAALICYFIFRATDPQPTLSFLCLGILLFVSGAISIGSLFLALSLADKQRYAISLIQSSIANPALQNRPPEKQRYQNSELIQLINQLETSISRIFSERILTKQAELAALQSQINPHFLYNTLDSIRGQALQDHMPQLAEMTEALSTFFRYSISTKDDFVTLEQELDNVKNYFTIQEYRFGSRFQMKYIFDPDDQMLIMGSLLPKLTLQPIIENAIFHGLEPKEDPGTITIRAQITQQRLLLVVSDDGVGMDEATLLEIRQRLIRGNYQEARDSSRSAGIALTNVNARIRLYFGDMYGLTINSVQGFGTDVNITLPVTQTIDRFQKADWV